MYRVNITWRRRRDEVCSCRASHTLVTSRESNVCGVSKHLKAPLLKLTDAQYVIT